MEGSVI